MLPSTLHMLHACYLNGTHKKFAKYCCEFSDVKVSVSEPKAEGLATSPFACSDFSSACWRGSGGVRGSSDGQFCPAVS